MLSTGAGRATRSTPATAAGWPQTGWRLVCAENLAKRQDIGHGSQLTKDKQVPDVGEKEATASARKGQENGRRRHPTRGW